MVIQRWQTVFLLLAAIFVAIFCFIPVGNIDGTAVVVDQLPVYLALNLVAVVMLLRSIFMYRNTRRQRINTIFGMVLIAVSIAVGIYFICTSVSLNSTNSFGAACLLLPAALIAAIIAYRRILADERLLRSYDRLR